MKCLLVIFLTFFTTIVFCEEKIKKKIVFEEGLDKYQTEALFPLKEVLLNDFEEYLYGTGFKGGPNKFNSIVPCEENEKECRHNLNYSFKFEAASIDLNNDGIKEVLIQFVSAGYCGAGGPCYTDVLYKSGDTWILIGDDANDLRGSNLYVSNKYKNGFQTIFYNGKSRWSEKEDKFISNKYKCEFNGEDYKCGIPVKLEKVSTGPNQYKIESIDSSGNLLTEFYNDDVLRLRVTFSSKENRIMNSNGIDIAPRSYDNVEKEEWFDENGKLFKSETLESFKYIYSPEYKKKAILICNSKILNIINIKKEKNRYGTTYINKKEALSFSTGATRGPCSIPYFYKYFKSEDKTIFYFPHDYYEGCISLNDYNPITHDGKFYITEGNRERDVAREIFGSESIEEGYCHKK